MKNEKNSTKLSLIRSLLATTAAVHALPLRISLAVVMWPHGAQKLFGWFGGYGLSGTMAFFTESLGIPAPIALGVILVEFFAPLLLLLGLGTRVASAALAAVMLGAMVMVQWPHGFFMNWSGTQAGEGIQFTLLFVGAAIALVGSGGGLYSLDRYVVDRLSPSFGKAEG
ncbi:DoxX family protein [Coraliomargarita sp. SDUM461003]|uniref:DoxX family protein n=1 Tax=Thalassobacterium maritimum TaxID=3041265 RepID=A0ABU1AYE4_9BACT|nr:DoxX family protein [Coraliomargarita sp. SDUM461003]MDQ8209106.1 DoxX family protein [Coraliomargarita sp. SDUM461003]